MIKTLFVTLRQPIIIVVASGGVGTQVLYLHLTLAGRGKVRTKKQDTHTRPEGWGIDGVHGVHGVLYLHLTWEYCIWGEWW